MNLPLIAALTFLSATPHAFAENIRPEVIYDSDDRRELHEIRHAVSYFTARATVAFFTTDTLRNEQNGITTVLGGTYGGDNELCHDERFYTQPSGAFCSGVLVAPNMVLTAGHCVDKAFCENTRFALDYAIDAPNRNPRQLRTAEILECESLVGRRKINKTLDFALVRLKSNAHVAPLTISREKIAVGQELVLTGFPGGLPMKIVEGAKVQQVGRLYARAPLDAFGGNSGSPVVDARSGHLLGILVRGEDDFEQAPGQHCKRVRRCAKGKCRGEEILKISLIMEAFTRNM